MQTQTIETMSLAKRESIEQKSDTSKSNARLSQTESATEKDITISNFEGETELPEEPPVKRDSPEFMKKMNFKKEIVKGSLDLPKQGFDLMDNEEIEKTKRMRFSAENKEFVEEKNEAWSKELEEECKRKVRESYLQSVENSSMIYSCLASYVGYQFSTSENNRTTNSILNKCLEGGKVNYPDLFLRFMD